MTNEEFKIIKFINENAYNVNIDIFNEAAQANLSNAVVENMIKLTLGKYSKLDMGDISKSHGNITRCKFYNNLKECVTTLLNINRVTGKIPNITIISDALDNIIKYTPHFEEAFRENNSGVTLLYNTTVYAIMEATSYTIAATISFSKSLSDKNYKLDIIQLDNGDVPLINALTSFNKVCASGDILKYFKTMKINADTLTESTIGEKLFSIGADFLTNNSDKITAGLKVLGITAAVAVLIMLIVPCIREIVYWIYRCKHNISETARLQAEFIYCNIEVLKNSNIENKDQVIAKQTKSAEKFMKIAKAFALDSDKAAVDSSVDIRNDKTDVSAIVI